MKRDDKLPFSYGGNKVRIAHELMNDIMAGGYTAVISYGSESSNMNRAIADMANAYGIKCYVIIKTEDEREGKKEAADNSEDTACNTAYNKSEDTALNKAYNKAYNKAEKVLEAGDALKTGTDTAYEIKTENERLVNASGAELIYCTDGNVRECVEAVFARVRKEGYKPYYIYGDSTGSGNELSLMRASYSEYAEIKEYEQESGIKFDAIVLTAGTGMTIAGLAAALNDELAGSYALLSQAENGNAITNRIDKKYAHVYRIDKGASLSDYQSAGCHVPRLIGISAARTTANSIAHIRNDLLTYYKGDESSIKLLPEIIDSYLCGGYGRYNADIESVILDMESKGTALDPCYTGKSYLGMLSEIHAGRLRGNILFIHTGGYPVYMDWKKSK